MPSPEEQEAFDKELAILRLVGYLELFSDKMKDISEQLDVLDEAIKKFKENGTAHG